MAVVRVPIMPNVKLLKICTWNETKTPLYCRYQKTKTLMALKKEVRPHFYLFVQEVNLPPTILIPICVDGVNLPSPYTNRDMGWAI